MREISRPVRRHRELAVIRTLAAGGPLAAPLAELGSWLAVLILIPGVLAARRWNAPR